MHIPNIQFDGSLLGFHCLLGFPCEFPIKAMGKAGNDFDMLIVGIVRKHIPNLLEGAVKTSLSKEGRFISVTVKVQAENREQLDNIYMELTAHERVIMVL